MSLGDGTTWDETLPSDLTLATLIDDHIRDLRVGVRSRMELEHNWSSTQASTAAGGQHTFITMKEQASKPTIAGTQLGAVYMKTAGAGLQELFWENEAGTEVQVTNRTGLSGAGLFGANLLHVRDEKASGTAAGVFNSGDWRTRTLNTSKTNEIAGASLASNQITLPAGTYYIDAWASAWAVTQHKAKLRDTTNSANLVIGSSEWTNNSTGGVSDSIVKGRFTLAAQAVLELQHYCNSPANFGTPASMNVVEVYAEVLIWKVA